MGVDGGRVGAVGREDKVVEMLSYFFNFFIREDVGLNFTVEGRVLYFLYFFLIHEMDN